MDDRAADRARTSTWPYLLTAHFAFVTGAHAIVAGDRLLTMEHAGKVPTSDFGSSPRVLLRLVS